MRKISGLLILLVIFFASCTSKTEKNVPVSESKSVLKSEADLLEEYLSKSGDYVNSRQFPSMIKAETAIESLDSSTLFIDIRSAEAFSNGHAKGAVNVAITDLPVYFETGFKPYEYDKIVIACDHGQRSSYATLLLRLMGYGNVYSLRWGMAAWNPKLGGDRPWSDLLGSEYTSMLETKDNPANPAGGYPQLNTGLSNGEEIFKVRVKQLFEDAPNGFTVGAEEVFANPSEYYIINYERKDKYESGHIPGSVRYKPGATLGIAAEMKTIPTDKDVVVYCATGHNSAFVVAYLRLFGYNAYSLRYGNNSFMHDKMLQDETKLSWEVFTEKEMMKEYPFSK